MSLLNKVLSFFGLGNADVQEEPATAPSHKKHHRDEPCPNGCNCNSTPNIVIEPVVESQETPVEVEIKVEAPTKPAKPKTAASKRPKGSSSKSGTKTGTKTGTKKSTGTRKPRTPRKPKED